MILNLQGNRINLEHFVALEPWEKIRREAKVEPIYGFDLYVAERKYTVQFNSMEERDKELEVYDRILNAVGTDELANFLKRRR